MANNQQIAEQVLAAVGGKANVSSATHCMTRLLFSFSLGCPLAFLYFFSLRVGFSL